jgi:hypothetical protein
MWLPPKGGLQGPQGREFADCGAAPFLAAKYPQWPPDEWGSRGQWLVWPNGPPTPKTQKPVCILRWKLVLVGGGFD